MKPVTVPEPAPKPPAPEASEEQVKKIMALFHEVATLRGIEVTRDNRLAAYTQWAGRNIATTTELSRDEASTVIDRLDSWIADLVAAADTSDGELVQGELIDDEVQS